jgi:hypothetical protein
VIAALLIFIVLYAGMSATLSYFYYEKRPILHAMRVAPGLASWVDDSEPAKEALFKRLPPGTNLSTAIAALVGEGFQCGDTSSTRSMAICGLDVQEGFVTTFWSIRLSFGDDGRLTDAKIGLRSLAL